MIEFFLISLLWLTGGLFAVSGFIIEKKPNAKEIFDKIIPAQGVIGCILIVLGLVGFVRILSMINFFFLWVTLMFPILLIIVLGIILGYGLINKYVLSRNEAVREKGAMVQDTLVRFQTPVGWMSVGFSLMMLFVFLTVQVHGRQMMQMFMY